MYSLSRLKNNRLHILNKAYLKMIMCTGGSFIVYSLTILSGMFRIKFKQENHS